MLRFLGGRGGDPVNRYTLDGRPIGKTRSPGLVAMAAAAGQGASDAELARPFVQKLWNAPAPAGKWRYYDGLLTMLGLLQAGGRFVAYDGSASAPAAAGKNNPPPATTTEVVFD